MDSRTSLMGLQELSASGRALSGTCRLRTSSAGSTMSFCAASDCSITGLATWNTYLAPADLHLMISSCGLLKC